MENGKAVPVDTNGEETIDRIKKVVAVRLQVKPDKIRSEHSFQDLSLPGTNLERFEVRPGDVPEETDNGVGPPLLDEPGQKREVIILNQNKRPLSTALLDDFIGELLINLFVSGPVFFLKQGTMMRQMTERPHRLV